ncbi:HAD-IA family hydrolase [Bacillus carboniphilus]|uniref:HAD-IA family hydrolase n=1 Tax=Bacillus carboniphilus TaxID=86663 RepID=A0ABP3FP65_9BACI
MNLLWDFDGTLFDTYPLYVRLLDEVLDGKVDKEELYKQLKVSFSHAIDYFHITKEQMEKMRELEEKVGIEMYQPFPDVMDVLRQAKKNVIVTHKEREIVEKVLDFHGMAPFFEEVIGKEDGYPRKPDISAYSYMNEKFSLDGVVGDRDLDLIPGKKLKLTTIMFQGESEVADVIIQNYREFPYQLFE